MTYTFTRNHFESFTFDASGRLVAMGDQNGNTTTLAYSGSPAKLAEMTDSAGRKLFFHWNGTMLDWVKDQSLSPAGGRQMLLSYTNGDLTGYTDPAGGQWSFGYQGATHLLTSFVKPRHAGTSKAVVNVYDSTGRVTSQTDELGRTGTIEYDTPVAGSTRITEGIVASPPPGWTPRVRIDRFVDGRREETTTGVGTPEQTSTKFAYDPLTFGLTSVTDNAQKTTTFMLDPATGNPLSATDPTGRITEWTYNSFDQVLNETTGKWSHGGTVDTSDTSRTEWAYNSLGHLTTVIAAKGTADEATTLMSYDPTRPEDLVTLTDARSKIWQFTYDKTTGTRGTGYQLSATDPLGNTTASTFNEIGAPLTATAAEGVATPSNPNDYITRFAYDVTARTQTVTSPTGEITRTVLDPDGNVATTATGITTANPTATGDVTAFGYDDADQPVTVTHPPVAPATTGTVSSTAYWPDGRSRSTTNENNQSWTYSYDGAGRLFSDTDPDGGTRQYRYDTAGNLASVRQPDPGATCTATVRVACVTYAYDDASRPTKVLYSDPATTSIVGATGGDGITYDGTGRRLTSTTGGVTETWAWDKRSEVTSTKDANGRITGYTWDKAGNLTFIDYPGPSAPLRVTRTFDDAGRLSKVKDWSNRETSFGYDRNNNWTTTGFAGAVNNDVYGYDQANRMTSATWKKGTTTLGSETYTNRPNAKGMVKTLTPTGTAGTGAKTASYDTRDRLTGIGSESYKLDSTSNLTRSADGRTQVFDPAQRLCWSSVTATSGSCATPPSDATTFSYDARGNRTSQVPARSAPTTLAYDQANRLTEATVPSALGGDGQLVTFPVLRMVDTVWGTGSCSPSPCGRLTANVAKTVQVAGQTPIPASNVDAVWATITINNPGAAGVLKINQNGTAAAVTINFDASVNRSETAIIPLVNGAITITSSAATDLIIDTTGYFKTAGSPGDTYRPVTPIRLADTRNGTGTCNGGPCSRLAANSNTGIKLTGTSGVPATGVHAVVVSLTVVDPAVSGQAIIAWGWGSGGAATITYQANKNTNETVIVPVNANGTADLYTSAATDLLIDVSAYFSMPVASDPGLSYQPLAPAVVATSSGTGSCGAAACGPFVAGTRQTIQVSGTAGIPASASAVVGNFTITNPAADGFAQINPDFASGVGLNGGETINFTSGQTRNSIILVPLRADGTIQIVSTQPAGWTFEASGYLTQPVGTYHYAYDSSGLRRAKTDPTNATTQYSWTTTTGLPTLVGQHDTTGSTWIINGPGDQPIEQINPDGTATWLHQDQLASIRLTTNAINGTTASTRTYDSYGNPTTTTGPQPILGYNAQQTDPETGYQYLRARYYDPKTGQFLTQDPLVAQTGEPYGYTGGNPLNGSDPSGLCGPFGDGPCTPGGIVKDVKDMCIDTGGNDSCDTVAEKHPVAAQRAVDVAGGILSANPITSTLPLDLEGHGVNVRSGYFAAGKWGFVAVETLAGFSYPGAAAGNTLGAVLGSISACGQARDARCGAYAWAALASIPAYLVGAPPVSSRFMPHLFNIMGNIVTNLDWAQGRC